MEKFLIGLATGIAIAYLAYRAEVLDLSGAFAAGVLGTIVFGLGGVSWALVLLTFFISASGISKLFQARKSALKGNFAKGSKRDAWQVSANGGVGGAIVLAFIVLNHFIPDAGLLPALWLGYAASFAAANADTWATELGVLIPRHPVLATSFKRVLPGTSGGISLVGSLAAVTGSALVAGMAVFCSWMGWTPAGTISLWMQFLIVTLSGFIGAVVDSILGATIQVVYKCPVCEKETEQHPVHFCGIETVRKRGLTWLNNDWVNVACTLSGGIVGIVLGTMI